VHDGELGVYDVAHGGILSYGVSMSDTTWNPLAGPLNLQITANDIGLGGFVGQTPTTLPVSEAQQAALNAKANATDLGLKANASDLTALAVSSLPTIKAATTFRVSGIDGDHGGLLDTFNYLRGFRIAPNATLRIQLLDSTINIPVGQQLFLDHPDGARIQIVGNQADRSKVQINCPNLHNQGFLVALNTGCGLGLIDGVTITGVGGWKSHGEWDVANEPNGWAILNSGGSHITVGANVKIEKFMYGVRAEAASSITCAPGCWVDECGDVGYFGYLSGAVVAAGCKATNCGVNGTSLTGFPINQGTGFRAEGGGTCKAPDSISYGHTQFGGASVYGGFLDMANAKVHDCQTGLLAADNGSIAFNSDGGQAEVYNCTAGLIAAGGGKIGANSAYIHDISAGGAVANNGKIDLGGAKFQNIVGSVYSALNQSVIAGTIDPSSSSYGPRNVDNTSLGEQYVGLVVDGINFQGPITQTPPASITPTVNGAMAVQATSDTKITVKLKGSDGLVRSIDLTLT
jgi:hypothetical protein